VEERNVNIHTVQFSHILKASDLKNLHDCLSRTVFVISHKNESIETLLEVLWYLPVNSPIIIVTNCQQSERGDLTVELRMQLTHHKRTYRIHQKDETIARLFETDGVSHILSTDGKVIEGKGEGMSIGTLCAYQLGYPRWILFDDAVNFVPSALLEYTLTMSRLFMSVPLAGHSRAWDTLIVRRRAGSQTAPDLHNVRICWSSKPELSSGKWNARIMGRCTRVVSPLFNDLLEGWFGIHDHPIRSSNAREQGMTVKTALSLRFSSGFSVETFQLLDLLFHTKERQGSAEGIILQQYFSKSPHFHEKKGDGHIKQMIEQSLGSFFHCEASLPHNVRHQLQGVYDELRLELVSPALYPPLKDLPLKLIERLMDRYALFTDADCQDILLVQESQCA
jgi:mannosyl-3-phosphoglycerate synthase